MTVRVVVDGVVCRPDEAKVSVFDRGFLYGDSVFETIRTYQGEPFELAAHLTRLKRSAERVFIELPVSLDVLASEVRQGLKAAGNAESYVRVMVTRGSGPMGLDPRLAVEPLRVVVVTPLTVLAPQKYTDGVAVITHRTARTTESTPAEGAKVGNYLVNLLATREARRAGAEEALVVDGDGYVVEGASSNVFCVIGGQLVTPPVDAGILEGITRANILQLAKQLGVSVEFRSPALDELRTAQEVFISSSIRELLPVVAIDDAPVALGTVGPVTRRLLTAFREMVAKSIG